MISRNEFQNEYFEWMFSLVCEDRFPKENSYRKLLMHLHDIEFTFTINRDKNRYSDGIDLRRRFSLLHYSEDLSALRHEPCSVFEMILALAIRCETDMQDTSLGDRTGQWFWGMISNLGLGAMFDENYDKTLVDEIITRFLNREYSRDGKGGLFTVRDRKKDLRKVEIWYQLNWYLDSVMY